MSKAGPLRPFLLERYFAPREHSARRLLSSSDCDGWPLAELLSLADAESRALWEGLRLGYTEPAGLPALRREIAALHGADPGDVVVAGPQECIFLAMTAILEGGGHAVCAWPGYQSLYEVGASLGARVDRWEPEEQDGAWRFDVDALERLLRPDTRLVVINFPHNPTGAQLTGAELRRVAALAEARGAWLFSDEMYRLLERRDEDRLPSACGLYRKAVSLSGMSKSFGLAGLRLGWLVVRDAGLRERIAELKDYTSICPPAPSEALALAALRAREAILSRHRARISRNLDLLDAFFARRAGLFRWSRPSAGSVGFPAFLGGEPVDRFCDRLLAAEGAMLLPSTVYEYPRPHVRIGFGREDLPESLAVLDRFLTRGAGIS